jgi:hypothetical protein
MTTKLDNVLYTAKAHTTGGREGRSVTDDGLLDVTLAPPKEMGGKGGATNPEQLFAAGYSACFIGAMKFVAAQKKSPWRRKSTPASRSARSLAVSAWRWNWRSACRAWNAPRRRSWWMRRTRFARTRMRRAVTSMSR